MNASVSKVLGNNYKESETNFDAKDVTIPFQKQTTQLDQREMQKKQQQFKFDALRSQDAENAIEVFKKDGKLGGGSKV